MTTSSDTSASVGANQQSTEPKEFHIPVTASLKEAARRVQISAISLGVGSWDSSHSIPCGYAEFYKKELVSPFKEKLNCLGQMLLQDPSVEKGNVSRLRKILSFRPVLETLDRRSGDDSSPGRTQSTIGTSDNPTYPLHELPEDPLIAIEPLGSKGVILFPEHLLPPTLFWWSKTIATWEGTLAAVEEVDIQLARCFLQAFEHTQFGALTPIGTEKIFNQVREAHKALVTFCREALAQIKERSSVIDLFITDTGMALYCDGSQIDDISKTAKRGIATFAALAKSTFSLDEFGQLHNPKSTDFGHDFQQASSFAHAKIKSLSWECDLDIRVIQGIAFGKLPKPEELEIYLARAATEKRYDSKRPQKRPKT